MKVVDSCDDFKVNIILFCDDFKVKVMSCVIT